MDIRRFTTFVSDIPDLVSNASALQTARIKCLAKYLTELECQSILVEPGYTDGGYLVDYANYYARCHEPYEKSTTRLHFFSLPPEPVDSAFAAIHEGRGQQESLQEKYLGFVVFKPLPYTIIGRTCLKPYPAEDKLSGRKRFYPVLRHYRAHVFGAALSVNSIAFQEQDNEVAACSTAAIWYSLHALPDKFTVQQILSPYEITSSGSSTYIRRNLGEVTRRFPTNGLALEQIEAYFRSHGLECIVSGMKPEQMLHQLTEAVATFVRAGLPMVVVGQLYTSGERAGPYQAQGLHAVTTLGFACNPGFSANGWSSKLVRLFAHDDNVGPFSSYRLETCKPGQFLESPQQGSDATETDIERAIRDARTDGATDTRRFTGFLMNESGTNDSGLTFRRLVPYYFLIPLDPKVRFPYETVHLFGQQIEQRIWHDYAPKNYPPGPIPPVSSSVQLLDVGKLQAYFVKATTIEPDIKKAHLLYPGPRHVWMLSFFMSDDEGGEIPVMDVLFDATALKQSGGLLTVVPHTTQRAIEFFAVMVATMRSQGETLIRHALLDMRPVLESFRVQVLELVGLNAPDPGTASP